MAIKTIVSRRGTDVQRQTVTPANGEFIWTTDLKELWVGDGATLGGVKVTGTGGGGGVGIKNTFEYVATASQTIFSGADINTVTLAYTVGNIYVIVDGFHISTSDYTATDGTSIVFSTGLNAGQEVSIIAFDEYTLGALGDTTVNGNLTITGNIVGPATVSGDLTVTGTITESSAKKYKENIEPLEDSLGKISKLQGVSYNKIGSDETEIGLIADEVFEVIPDVVHVVDGEVEGINYSRLVAHLIESVKELKKEIEVLKGNG